MITSGKEIERRYLVRVDPAAPSRWPPPRRLRQGYLRLHGPSVRIRLGEAGGGVLNCKSGSGLVRDEVETTVPDAMAEALWRACESTTLEKDRFRIGRWELDRFAGDLEGLWVLEVELVAVDEPTPPVPEGVEILREMTDVNTFTSAALAALSPEAARTLVQTVYGRSE